MPDSTAIDAALSATLLGDPTLMALVPDGVFFDEAVDGARKFLIISLVDEHDVPMFGSRAFEDATYLVKAVMFGASGLNANAAAARIDALLDMRDLVIAGYGVMVMRREERIRSTEVDEVDASIRWQHRGGRYQVMAAPA